MEEEAILASQSWINAGGMILLTVGISLLILEFFLPSFGLFGFAGAGAILIGVVQLHQTGYIEEMPISINALIILALLGFALAALGGYYSFRLYQKKNTTGIEAMIGKEARVLSWKNTQGKVHFEGEDWQAYSDDSYSLKRDDKVLISKIDGLRIKISYTTSNE
jgi:membrane-bound serine protease (ClpP class)